MIGAISYYYKIPCIEVVKMKRKQIVKQYAIIEYFAEKEKENNG